MFGYGVGYSWFGMLLNILVWVLIIAGVLFMISKIGNKDNRSNVFRILDEKLATGEITEEEYKRKKDLLKESQKS